MSNTLRAAYHREDAEKLLPFRRVPKSQNCDKLILLAHNAPDQLPLNGSLVLPRRPICVARGVEVVWNGLRLL